MRYAPLTTTQWDEIAQAWDNGESSAKIAKRFTAKFGVPLEASFIRMQMQKHSKSIRHPVDWLQDYQERTTVTDYCFSFNPVRCKLHMPLRLLVA